MKPAGLVVALALLVLVPGVFLCLWAFSGGHSGAAEPVEVSFDDIIRAMPPMQMKPGKDRAASPNWSGQLADGTRLFITGPKESLAGATVVLERPYGEIGYTGTLKSLLQATVPELKDQQEWLGYFLTKCHALDSQYVPGDCKDEVLIGTKRIEAKYYHRSNSFWVTVRFGQTPETAEARSIPESASRAFEALKKLQAKTEIGINKVNYGRELGEVWYVVKTFLESQDAKQHPRLSRHLVKAMESFKAADEAWEDVIRWHSDSRRKRKEQDRLKAFWRLASYDLSWAGRLMKDD